MLKVDIGLEIVLPHLLHSLILIKESLPSNIVNLPFFGNLCPNILQIIFSIFIVLIVNNKIE